MDTMYGAWAETRAEVWESEAGSGFGREASDYPLSK